MDNRTRTRIQTKPKTQKQIIQIRHNTQQPTRKLQNKQTTKRQNNPPTQTIRLQPNGNIHRRANNRNDNNLCQTGNLEQCKTTTLLQPTKPIRFDNELISKLPSQIKQIPHQQNTNSLLVCPLILLRRTTNFIFIVVSNMWRNWKTVEIKSPNLNIPDDDPIFKYDDHHDEIININTGEVIK